MLSRRSRIATYLTKRSGIVSRNPLMALGAGGAGLAAAGLVASDDVKKGLAGLSPQVSARRRAMGFPNLNLKSRYGYGAVREAIERT